ncbi:hypothetical protein [Actinoplanes awajinensis]|uniref:Uncharacterized protein n=1 Tax=Actinoplanes awajinensis subsp. mycoplanecinus TaxID=135947 RepID=A0A101J9L9_9ACTN|nr:hypothetical protein [Actinoplanes awajinensis]KUL22813.1 hypothetical protein ADL15_47345 [Actinoplanes awajinensis subsp. mycoplanecinus]
MNQYQGWRRDSSITGHHESGRDNAQRVVASAEDFAVADRAVQRLVECGVPARGLSLVGRDLRVGPPVVGQLPTPEVALRGGVLGLLVSASVAWLLVVSDLVDPVAGPARLTLSAMIMGAVFGSSLGVAGYGLTRSRRPAPAQVRAGYYAVLVDEELADRAAWLLQDRHAGLGTPPSSPAAT